MKYTILHSIHSKLSRDFVANLPKDDNEYEIIDWYGDEKARFSYNGPPASSFPSVAFEQDQEFYIIREPDSWKEINEAVSSAAGKVKFKKLSCCTKDEFIGGQRMEELEALVKTRPQYFTDVGFIKKCIEKYKGKKELNDVNNTLDRR